MNQIAQFIKSQERPSFPFVPSMELYLKTGIGRKRFAQIYRGEVSPTLDEITALANYFNAPFSELIKQL